MPITPSTGILPDAEQASASLDMRKRDIRRTVIGRRKRVPQQVRDQAALSLSRHHSRLLELAESASGAAPISLAAQPRTVRKAPTIAAYVSMGSEIPTKPLLAALLADGIRLMVPKLGNGLDIGWGMLDGLSRLYDMGDADIGGPSFRHSNRPQEPDTVTLPAETLRDADLILVPALAVDHNGTRLGRGGGWYDRALAHRRPDVRIIAVCWPWECVGKALPCLPHDLPVDGVLTPDWLRMLPAGTCHAM